MKIPTLPVHRLAKKPGIPSPLYSRKHACVLATNGTALVRVRVDQDDEDPECMATGQIPPDVWAAACDQTPAKGTSELRLTKGLAKLDVYDEEAADVFQVVMPRELTLFDEQMVENLAALVPTRERGTHGVARVTLNAHHLALLATVLGVGSADSVHLELRYDIDGVVRKAVRVLPAEMADDDFAANSPDCVGALLTRESEPWSTWIPVSEEPSMPGAEAGAPGEISEDLWPEEDTPPLPGLGDSPAVATAPPRAKKKKKAAKKRGGAKS